MSETIAAPVHRNCLVDEVGFVNELYDQHVKKRLDQVKASMLDGKQDLVEGDFFQGRLVAGGVVRSIIAKKFHALIAKGQISEAQFLECISVNRSKAEEYVGGAQLDKMSTEKSAAPKLTVTRKKGVVLQLVDVVKNLRATLLK